MNIANLPAKIRLSKSVVLFHCEWDFCLGRKLIFAVGNIF